MRGTGASVTRRGNDLVLELPADVTFAFDKADIQPRFLGTLSAVARSLTAYRATDVEIIGHTDSIGSDQYNLALSERRGRSVADFLVDRAADPSRLVVEAMGKSEPIASNATLAGRAANRRVELVFHPRID
ncbi:MAG: OmpA family protein [Pseudomonadota bacterium]|nr:OmpA family protein [Pseudomonadota bacterium]